ncbi:hypothetical protein [Streptomyces sp. NPDC059788]|uniref:hypothetical protein n=1 Tax=Streptomyces sp. NPDC059788 TaxID=3346948 RepID=UPI00365D7518
MSAVLLGASQTSAAATPVKSNPTPAAAPATAPGSGGASLERSGSGSSAEARGPEAVCTFKTRGDYVHVSSSAFEASGHGWWVNGNCPTSTAVVTVELQEYYNDGRWRTKGTVGQATVRSGGGAGNRATGRAGCDNNTLTGWRSVVDVDLVGVADTPEKLITPARNINCRRY